MMEKADSAEEAPASNERRTSQSSASAKVLSFHNWRAMLLVRAVKGDLDL